jgi:hypothetical protein
MGVHVRSEVPKRMVEWRVKYMLTTEGPSPNKLIGCQGASIAIQLQRVRGFGKVLWRV